MPETPENTLLTLDDLLACGAESVLGMITEPGYVARHSALTDAASDPNSTNTEVQRNALRFLAGICSMMLSSTEQDDPFGAMIVLHDRRSMLPGDLSPEELTILESYLAVTDDVWLKARLAHLLWLYHTPKDHLHAIAAIDNYAATSLTSESWIRDGHSAWYQAVSLAKTLGYATSSLLHGLESDLVSAALGHPPDAEAMIMYVEPLLRSQRLGLDRAAAVAAELTQFGELRFADGDFLTAGASFQRAQWWLVEASLVGDAHKAAIREADSYVSEAQHRASASNPSFMVAAHWYEDALRALRSIPHAARDALMVDERISQTRERHADAIDRGRHEVIEIETPGIDITDVVLATRSALAGKPLLEALALFLNMIQSPDIEQYRKQATEQVSSPSIRHLITGVYQSHDGRTVGHRPSASPLTPETEQESFILSEMIFEYQFFVGICSAQILVGLDSIHSEHRVSLQDFVNLAEVSPMVPRGRANLVGRALHLGYERDFASSIHLLVPQVEHMLRESLSAAGVETSTVLGSGISRHRSLENLLALSDTQSILQPTLYFELMALLCDPFREGLRNEICHGLLPDAQIVSQVSIYVWWLIFKLVFNPVWLAGQDGAPGDPEDDSADSREQSGES